MSLGPAHTNTPQNFKSFQIITTGAKGLKTMYTTSRRILASSFRVFRGYRGFRPTQQCSQGARRQYSSSSSSYSSSPFHPYVDSTLHQIDSMAPKFSIPEGQIEIIQQPSEFYQLLKRKIRNAEKRIFLSTLYIGKSETELVDCLDEAMSLNDEVEVYILTDCLRGTREAPDTCSASLLAPLAQKHGPRVRVCMYHTPNLNGAKKTFIPHRFNEGWGLQHMKLYGFDDEIILSGANLSKDYFTNRQDRYILFKNAALTEYFFKIHQVVSQLSYNVVPSKQTKSGFKLMWPHYYSAPEPTVDPVNFIKAATRKLKPLLGPQNSPESTEQQVQAATVVYPISQFTQLMQPDTSTEFTVLSRVLSMLGTGRFDWTLTAGYFNIHPEFKSKLLQTKPQRCAEVITAAPQANGFYKSQGVSGLLPGAYSELSRTFLQAAQEAAASRKWQSEDQQIKLYEWQNGVVNTPHGWSYHAKGLWVTQPGDDQPFMSVIGSSNYTRRAYSHDLETNVLLVTQDPAIKSALAQEVEHLKEHTKLMKLEDFDREDRKPDWRQKSFIKYMGDKL